MHKNTKQITGKTIKSVDTTSINCWVLEFTDGTKIDLWAEIDGPYGLGQLYLDRHVPSEHKPAQVA